MNRFRVLFVAFGLVLMLLPAWPAAAQGKMDVLKELVPPPRMLLRHQEALGITDKQKSELKQVIKQAQAESLDLEFEVQEEAEKLAKIIGADNVDVDRALAQADVLMKAESDLKRVKLKMMLQTKAILTKDQLRKIEEFRQNKRKEREQRRERRRQRANEQ